jgi:hypothetical protein
MTLVWDVFDPLYRCLAMWQDLGAGGSIEEKGFDV